MAKNDLAAALIAHKPVNLPRVSSLGSPNVGKIRTAPKPAPPPPKPAPAPKATQGGATVKPATQARINIAVAEALKAATKPETYTASGALDFGINTLRKAGILPADSDPASLPTSGPVSPASSAPSAPAQQSFIVPLLLVAVAAWFLIKK